MKVERSSLDQVKARFAMNKKKKEEDSKKKDYDFDSRIKELENEVCHIFCIPYHLLVCKGRNFKSHFSPQFSARLTEG